MFWLKCAPAWLLCLCAVPACAFTFSYGNLFDVKDVKNDGGALVMPLARGKYKNVKVLSKDVYDFLLQCKKDCRYPAPQAHFEAADCRRAFTNENMMIADVDFNGEIILTFIVFKNKRGYSVKTPAEAVFKDGKLEKRIKKRLTALAEETL